MNLLLVCLKFSRLSDLTTLKLLLPPLWRSTFFSSSNQRPQRKKTMISTRRKKTTLTSRYHRPSPVYTAQVFVLFTPDLDTYSRWTHTPPSPTKHLPDSTLFCFQSLLTPGGHLQILISANLSKLQH